MPLMRPGLRGQAAGLPQYTPLENADNQVGHATNVPYGGAPRRTRPLGKSDAMRYTAPAGWRRSRLWPNLVSAEGKSAGLRKPMAGVNGQVAVHADGQVKVLTPGGVVRSSWGGDHLPSVGPGASGSSPRR